MSLEGNAEKNTLLQKLSGKIRYVPELDETLTHPDKAANAKAVGDAIARVEGKADMMVPNVSKNVNYNGAKSGLNAVNVQDAIDELNENKAPSGYGLGTHATGLAGVNLDEVTLAGFYCFDSNVGILNTPTSLPSILLVKPFYNENFVEQEIILLDGKGTRVKRVRHGGTWGAWEYENPPMTLWEEYRTTEKYLGKPVYTKLIKAQYTNDIGNSGGSYNSAIEFSTPNFHHLVRYGGTLEIIGAEGYPSPNPIPFFDDGGGTMGINYMNQGGLAFHLEKHVIKANTPFYIQVWYTKLTD